MNVWLEEVKKVLVGRTVIDVVEYATYSDEDPDLCEMEGVVLILDNGDNVRVAVDYDDVDLNICDVTPSKYEDDSI